MTKIFCDLCGKEIIKRNEVWEYKLNAVCGNQRVSYNEKINDVCEECATILHCCTSMMKKGFVPNLKEGFWEKRHANIKSQCSEKCNG